MAKITYTLVVNVTDPYQGNSLNRLLPTADDPTRTAQDVFKAEYEEKIEKVSNIIKGDIQLIFESITEVE